MADTLTFGISRFPGEFIDEVSVKESLEIAKRKNRVGVTKKLYPYDPHSEISIKGGGTPALALGVVADNGGITGLNGGLFIVKEREASEGNERFNEFTLGAEHWPSGELGTAAGENAGGGA